MKRPIGVILSAIVLGLAALFLLLMAALMAFAGHFARHRLSTTASPHLAILFILGISVFYAILAVWAILTVIGILRLRSWARYSILVIGGGLAGIGTLMALGTVLTRTMFATTMPPRSPAPNPHIMAVIFAVSIAIYVLIAITGIWWLVYFNLRTTREFFLDPSLSALSPDGLPQRPIAITILTGFCFYSTACFAILAFLPVPAFLLGFILPVRYAHLLYLVFALISAFIGYGLLKLKESARLATIAVLLFGCSNVILDLFPWYQTRLRLYMAQSAALLSTTHPLPSFAFTRTLILTFALFLLILYTFLLWLLHRHRAAFTPPPPQTRLA